MIGDGINDSPALAQADISISLSSGTDIAIETGKIVLMRNQIIDVPKSIILSKKTMKRLNKICFLLYFTIHWVYQLQQVFCIVLVSYLILWLQV